MFRSAMSAASEPDWMRSRLKSSSQMETPAALSAANGPVGWLLLMIAIVTRNESPGRTNVARGTAKAPHAKARGSAVGRFRILWGHGRPCPQANLPRLVRHGEGGQAHGAGDRRGALRL